MSFVDSEDGGGDEEEQSALLSLKRQQLHPPSRSRRAASRLSEWEVSSASWLSCLCGLLLGLVLGVVAALHFSLAAPLLRLLGPAEAEPASAGLLLLKPPLLSLQPLPECARSLLLDLGLMHRNGLGSRLNSVLQAAASALREIDDRQLFLRDDGWNYQTLATYFLPPADVAPLLADWNDGDNSSRLQGMREQLYWPPAFNARSLNVTLEQRVPSVGLLQLRHAPGLVDVYPAALLVSASAAPSFAYPLTARCRIPHEFDLREQPGGSRAGAAAAPAHPRRAHVRQRQPAACAPGGQAHARLPLPS